MRKIAVIILLLSTYTTMGMFSMFFKSKPSPKQLLESGIGAIYSCGYKKAESEFKQAYDIAIKKKDNQVAGLAAVNLAEMFLWIDNTTETQAWFNKIPQQGCSDEVNIRRILLEAQMHLANYFSKDNSVCFAEAERLLNQANAFNEDSCKYLCLYGLADINLAKNNKLSLNIAEKNFRKVMEASQNNLLKIRAKYFLAITLARQNRHREAFNLFEELTTESTSVDIITLAQLELGKIYLSSNGATQNTQEAKRLFTLVAQQDLEKIAQATACAYLGEIELEAGNIEEAERRFIQSLAIIKKLPDGHAPKSSHRSKMGLADIYISRGDLSEALKYVSPKQMLELLSDQEIETESQAQAFIHLGELASRQNDLDSAEQYFLKVASLETFPEYKSLASDHLVMLLLQKNKPEEAASFTNEELRPLIEQFNTSPSEENLKHWIRLSKNLSQSTSSPNVAFRLLHQIAQRLIDTNSRRFKYEILDNLTSAFRIAKQTNNIQLQIKAAENLVLVSKELEPNLVSGWQLKIDELKESLTSTAEITSTTVATTNTT